MIFKWLSSASRKIDCNKDLKIVIKIVGGKKRKDIKIFVKNKNKKQENGSDRCKILPKDGNPRLAEYRKNVENMEVCKKKTVLRK